MKNLVAAAGLLAAGAAVLSGTSALSQSAASASPPATEKSALSSDWREEQWVPEDFISVLGGGPAVGPTVEAGVGASALCGDKAGNLYLLSGNMFNIVTPAGVVHPLAGSGRGYKDGPAGDALFDQGGEYNVARSIQCDAQGNIYTAENGNHLVRWIFKDKDGKWMVDTVAGGGKRSLKDGESCPPLEADLGGNIAVVAAEDGTLTIGGMWAGVFRLPPDRKALTKLGVWSAYRGRPAKGGAPCLVNSDGDRLGNAYFFSRTPDLLYRVSREGKIEHIGIQPDLRAKRPGDGPPMEIYFDTGTSMAANPDGSCVYLCGGDEYDIRRVPTDLKTTTATLVCNGRWYIMPVHPGANRGKPDFDPALTGKSKNEGGPLSNLANCHINGRDYEGNLYGSIYQWVGATQNIAGKGKLRTGIYRLRRGR
ncbi:MAG: hypothetical protein C0404_10085 [Verrucomicrobia bacterium]|nr:hypothetical protein [Verrucomicrobiota bacterium]